MGATVTRAGAGTADGASRIALEAFNQDEALTAVRDGSGGLLLTGWATEGGVERRADSGPQGEEVSRVALSILGRRAVTSVRTGDGRLKLVSWDVPRGLERITRLGDSAPEGGEVSLVEAATLDASTMVTAVRGPGGRLQLASWRLEPHGAIRRVGDSGDQAGKIGALALCALGSSSRTVVTAVRTSRGTLKLIRWRVGDDGGIERLPCDREHRGGSVREIAMVRRTDLLAGTFPQPGVVTAVADGRGDLTVVVWRLTATGFEPVGERTTRGGRAVAIAPSGPAPRYLASMCDARGDLALVAFELGGGGLLSGPRESVRPGARASGTALVGLADGRALLATRAHDEVSLTSVSAAAPSLVVDWERTRAATVPSEASLLP